MASSDPFPRGRSLMTVLSPDFQLIPADEVPGSSPTRKFVAVITAAFSGVDSFPLAFNVYKTPELLLRITQYCDHFTLMSISRVSSHGRRTAQSELRSRIRFVLQPFISAHEFDSFIDMLHRTGTLVYGSVIRRLLMTNSIFEQDLDEPSRERFDSVANLNLTCPRGMERDCQSWFSAGGFMPWIRREGNQPARGFGSVMSRFVQMCKRDPASGELIYASIAFSSRTSLHVVLSSPFTSQSSFISSTRVYCPYPNLIASKYCVRSDIYSSNGPRHSTACYKIVKNNADWNLPCGPLCPGIIRKTVGDKGIASFEWNTRLIVPDSPVAGCDYLLADRAVFWQFSHECCNKHCSRYVPDPHCRKLK